MGTLVAPEVTLDADLLYRQHQQIFGLLTGQADWGAPIRHTSYDSDSERAHIVRNLGTGGHFQVQKSTDGSVLFDVQDTGSIISGLAISGDLSVGGTLSMTQAASRLVPGATSFSIRNNANGADNLLVSNSGGVTIRNGLNVLAGSASITGGVTVASGPLSISDAASLLVPGATSFAVRNNANTVNNLLVTDAGAVTTRGALTVTAGGLTVTAGGATVSAGNLAVSAGTITASSTVQGTQLISTVSTGTAPLTVASQTQVSNLNASLLEGHPASDFLTGLGGAVLTDSSSQTKAGALTIQGNFSATGSTLTLGDSSGDALTINATTAMGAATATTFTATTYLASGSTPATTGAVRTPNNDGLYGRNAANNANMQLLVTDGSNNLTVGDTSGSLNNVHIKSPNTTFLYGAGSVRIELNSTGIGFFAATPNAKQTVTGSRGGNAALQSLLSALANYGLITDSSS